MLHLQLRHAPGLPETAVLSGPNGDDQFLTRVQQFGETTEAAAQIKALASYGIKARFSTQARFSTLEEQIAAGIPVPCGSLHRGPISSPAGGAGRRLMTWSGRRCSRVNPASRRWRSPPMPSAPYGLP
ncbi:MAG: hypothetical protein NTY67_06250 [Cyanobacteria bacterium]|nr:hypothetical protein [Cyanobacteriota bacterium]